MGKSKNKNTVLTIVWMNEYPGVTEYVNQMKQKFIFDHSPHNSELSLCRAPIPPEKHFSLFQKKIEEFLEAKDDIASVIDEIVFLTVLTPIYPENYFEFFNQKLIFSLLHKVVTSVVTIQSKAFHCLVQFLLPQDPEYSLKILELFSSFLKTKIEYLEHLTDFWKKMRNLPSQIQILPDSNSDKFDKDVVHIFQNLRMYRDTRRKSSVNDVIPLPSFAFFPIIKAVSTILAQIDSKNSLPLLTLLAIEPLFAFPLVEKVPQPISFTNLPPLSMVYQVQHHVTHSFVSMYRHVLMPIFSLFGIFAKLAYLDSSHAEICGRFFRTIQLGVVGRDAFTLSLLSLYRTDAQKYVIERFFNYLANNSIKTKEHDFCVMGFVCAFDSLPSPSAIVLLNLDKHGENHILNTIAAIKDNYYDSPFKSKVESIYHILLGVDQGISLTHSAYSYIHFFNKEKAKPTVSAMNVLFQLSKTLHKPEHFIAFCGLLKEMPFGLTKNIEAYDIPNRFAIPEKQPSKQASSQASHQVANLTGHQINSVKNDTKSENKLEVKLDNKISMKNAIKNVIQFGDKNAIKSFIKTADRSMIKNTEKVGDKILDSSNTLVQENVTFPSIYFQLNAVAALISTTVKLPAWHYMQQLKDNAIATIVRNITLDEVLFYMKDPSISPSCLLGGLLIIVKSIPNYGNQAANLLSENSNYFLTHVVIKIALSELSQMYRLLIELTSKNCFITEQNFHFLIQEIYRFSTKYQFRFFFRIITALFQIDVFLKYISNNKEIGISILSLILDIAKNDSSIQKMNTLAYIWRAIGTNERFIEFLPFIVPLIKLSHEANPSEFFYHSLFLVLKLNSRSLSLAGDIEMTTWEPTYLYSKMLNSLPQQFNQFKSAVSTTDDQFPEEVDLSLPMDQIIYEITGSQYFCNQE
ncbi:hypothetical protein TRFO_03594 [Tritrichomonas foetus]|uniref:Uncharacterized protein n=1 Tax=Tritrichomonas foetus TaxID=1144522 RepID=A0A1J4KMQ2_9EUKA|nr:hypothetical protein TRFO_03594 [Tritrichomonas foetus]|eukprot:OHT12585.1 hypothetical protein TRFO_03594 [Tritrichomonas foetus]